MGRDGWDKGRSGWMKGGENESFFRQFQKKKYPQYCGTSNQRASTQLWRHRYTAPLSTMQRHLHQAALPLPCSVANNATTYPPSETASSQQCSVASMPQPNKAAAPSWRVASTQRCHCYLVVPPTMQWHRLHPIMQQCLNVMSSQFFKSTIQRRLNPTMQCCLHPSAPPLDASMQPKLRCDEIFKVSLICIWACMLRKIYHGSAL
jgi:hypothetical protein